MVLSSQTLCKAIIQRRWQITRTRTVTCLVYR